ncbi:MAG TPA: site-specific integrase [Micromonosporaceae bacterium]|jgi:integrase|nr:site-specific integrase [Micromonosporaceae bacterium]
MTSVSKRVRDGRTTYLVRWRDDAGRQHKRSFVRKVDADRYATEIGHTMLAGTYVDPKLGRETFKAYAERWRAVQPWRPNTSTRVASELGRHVYPVVGARPVAAVRPSEISALVASLSISLSPATVRVTMSTVRAIFRAAVRDRVVAANPCDGVKLPAVERRQVVPLTADQVRAIATHLPGRYAAIPVVGAGTGLRQGELFGLQVPDVDFLRRTMRVARQVQPHGVVPLKTAGSARTIPLGTVVVAALAEHLSRYPAGGDGWVFTDEDGRPLNRRSLERAWVAAVAAAGLPKLGMHQLRHTFASMLIGAGQSVKVVAERLGHSTVTETLNTYTHLWPADEDRTRDAVDDAFKIDRLAPRVRPARGA